MKATTTSRLPWDAPGADCDSKPSIFQGSEVFRCFESVQQSSGESEALCRRCHSVDLCCAALCAHRGACDPCFPLKDISQLRLSLMLNSAMCHLKQSDPARCVEVPCSGCCWRCLWRVKSCDTLSLRYAKKHSKSTAIASRLSFSQSSVRLLTAACSGAGRRFSGAAWPEWTLANWLRAWPTSSLSLRRSACFSGSNRVARKCRGSQRSCLQMTRAQHEGMPRRDGCNGVLQDKTIASELQRVEKDCMGKGRQAQTARSISGIRSSDCRAGVSSEAIETAQQKAEEAAKKGPTRGAGAGARESAALRASAAEAPAPSRRARERRRLRAAFRVQVARTSSRFGGFGAVLRGRVGGYGPATVLASRFARPWSRSPRTRRWSPRPRR